MCAGCAEQKWINKVWGNVLGKVIQPNDPKPILANVLQQLKVKDWLVHPKMNVLSLIPHP